MERLNIQEAFTSLKPLCDSLMRVPSVRDAKELQMHIKNISSAVVQDLQEYIIYPLLVHLQNDEVGKEVKQHLIDCMRAVISRTRISKIQYFNKLYTCLLSQIYVKEQPTMVIPNYEEFKESAVLCINNLVQRCTTDVIEGVYCRSYAPKLSQGIHLCVSIARKEKLRSLRLTAIETVMTLTQVHDDADTTDVVLKAQVADVIMFILPGIVSGLQEVALGSEIQGHKITMMAIRAWGRIIVLVMEDLPEQVSKPSLEALCKNNAATVADPLGNLLRSEGPTGLKKFMQTAERNQEWLDAAASKLKALMPSLVDLVKHSHFKVRKELAENVGLLLLKCSRNMKPNLTELVEILITLSEDDVEEVCTTAREELNKVSVKFAQENNSMRPLVELLEENFYKLLTRLPRIIRTSEESAQLSCLNQLAGYLRLLGKRRLPQVMASTAHLQRLLLALIYTMELDCSNVTLLEDVTIKDLDNIVHHRGRHPWKEFKFIRETATEQKLIDICQLLGEFGDLGILVDNVLGMIANMSQHGKELILLLNWIMRVKGTSALSLYGSVLESYIAPTLWYLPLTVSEDVSLREAQSNVVQCCLLVEGLGVLAETLGKEYDRFLLKTLYLVIERAGSGLSFVSIAGIQTLESFAMTLHHDNVADLLRANVDYFAFHITLKLRRIERNPGVLDVVAVVMKYSTIDVLPCLKEIVRDVLLQSNTNFQERNSYSFLKVLHTFTASIRRLVKRQTTEAIKREVETKRPAEIVIESLLEYYEAKRVSEQIEDDDLGGKPEDIAASFKGEDYEDLSGYENPDEEEKRVPPQYITMIEEVMGRCIHYLPSKDLARKLLAMETLQEGLQILADWEDQLLPIVHQLWHPLVDRFRDPSPLVTNRAWQLLSTLAHVSKNFIRSRTLKQVLPALSEFLNKAAKESHKKDSGSAYKFTQMYKLQRELLTQLGPTAKNLELQERDLWQLLGATQSYLSSYQHPTLQECCVEMYKEIADYNGDIVWVKCLSICSPYSELKPPDPCFPTIYLKVANSNIQNEYQKNIETILTYIEGKTLGM